MTTNDHPPDAPTDVLDLLESTRSALATAALPLELPDAGAARELSGSSIAQLDDYVLPRYRDLEAPLLAVVGGSTGAGKSTLVNAFAGHPVTRVGAIRPTTRQPVLLHHPADLRWFAGQRILPGLGRVTGHKADPALALPAHFAESEPSPGPVTSLVMVADEKIPQGVALLDAPDIDSVSDENRRLAGQLLAAADLWIFVTTANRYADAVPWKLLKDAASREITVAVVLDRVPDGVESEVSADLRRMLERQGLQEARLFVVREHPLDEREMLPPSAVALLRAWLEGLGADAAERAAVARRTLAGVVRRLGESAGAVAAAEREQRAAAARLSAEVDEAYARAAQRIDDSTRDGTLLRGEVLARWQDFVGTGEYFRSLEAAVGRLRDRIGAFFTGRPQPVDKVEQAIESGLLAVIVDQAARAAEEIEGRWRADPAGRQLLAGFDLGRASPGFGDAAAAQVREWQGEVMELIRTQGADRRLTARVLSFGVNGIAVALMMFVFASTAGLTGLEVGIAGGSAVVGQKLLEAVFGEDAVRKLAKLAREKLDERCRGLLAAEGARFHRLLAGLPDESEITRLETLAARLTEIGERP